MNLTFSTQSIRALCQSQVDAEREFGIDVARELKAIIADLKAASNVMELVAGSPRPTTNGFYLVDVCGDCHLLMSPSHEHVPTLADSGEIDWARVTRVMVLRVDMEPIDD